MRKAAPSLLISMTPDLIEAGCDEAGRGPLAGPVAAAAVILPRDFYHPLLNDSKKMTARERETLRPIIEKEALAWAVEMVSPEEIDRINSLSASITGMQRAVKRLSVKPQLLLIDGNRFIQYPGIPHTTIVKGDGKMMSIAAASVLAKTYRDDFMNKIALEYPQYDWLENKGYPTQKHREAIKKFGTTPYHRMSFNLIGDGQLSLDFCTFAPENENNE